MPLTLFQKDDCHLCDLALEMLSQARVGELDCEWIDGDASLLARYGSRVPVLREEASGRELDWPFDAAGIRRFLTGNASNPGASG